MAHEANTSDPVDEFTVAARDLSRGRRRGKQSHSRAREGQMHLLKRIQKLPRCGREPLGYTSEGSLPVSMTFLDMTRKRSPAVRPAHAHAPVVEAYTVGFREFWKQLAPHWPPEPESNAQASRVEAQFVCAHGLFTSAMAAGYRHEQTGKLIADEAERFHDTRYVARVKEGV